MNSVLVQVVLGPLLLAASASTPEQAVSTLWAALSNDPGGHADVVSLRRIFHADAVVFGGRYKDGTPVLRRSTAEAFLQPFARVSEKGFYECEIQRVVQVYDRFAVVYSVVESRTDPSSLAPDFVGVNSIQLYQVESQWQILSLYYHVQKDDLPIAVDSGESGKCLS